MKFQFSLFLLSAAASLALSDGSSMTATADDAAVATPSLRSSSKVEVNNANEEDAALKQHRKVYEAKIVNGEDADRGDYPFFINWSVGCGGSMIAPDIFLTAAHCIDGNGAANIGDMIVVSPYDETPDSDNISPTTIVRYIVDLTPHPDYARNDIKDVMVVKINEPVPNSVPMIKLNTNQNLNYPAPGADLRVIGFGDLRDGAGEYPDILQEVDVDMVSTSACNAGNKYDGAVTGQWEFCASRREGGKNKDSCQGDSGGPIFLTNNGDPVQVGVVSWGNGCALTNYPGVYARVGTLYNWIKTEACKLTDVSSALCPNGAPDPSPCNSNQIKFDFQLRTDYWGSETSFELKNAAGQIIARKNNGAYDDGRRMYLEGPQCLPKNTCYTLKIGDHYSPPDGMEYPGGWKVMVDNRAVANEYAPSDFTSEKIIRINDAGCNSTPPPPPPSEPGMIEVAITIQFDNSPRQMKVRLYDRATKSNYYKQTRYSNSLKNQVRTFTEMVPADKCTKLFLRNNGGLTNGKKVTVKVDGSQKFSGNLVSNNKNKKVLNIGDC